MIGPDTIIVVDWSGAGVRGPSPRPDAIWTAAWADHAEEPVYLRSSAMAEEWIVARAEQEVAAGRRVLLGMDFPFGYPAGLGQRLTGTPDPRILWDRVAEAFAGLSQGQDRFDVAAGLNALFDGEGPFWFNGRKREIPGLPRKKPARLPDGVAERRTVETLAPGSFACWQMGGAGAVGGQAMTGMALLSRLRRRLGARLSVWPFDPWDAAPVVAAEVWPSLLSDAVRRRMVSDPLVPRGPKGPIKDAAQVMVLVEALAHLRDRGGLDQLLSSVGDGACREEGWILGVGAEDLLRRAADAWPAPAAGTSEPAERSTPSPPPLRNDCFALPAGIAWTPVAEALARLRAALMPVTGVESVALDMADGRVLAVDAVARRSNPPAANAAVDGYGFGHAATGEGRQDLPLLAGRAAAGAPFAGRVPPGAALRILTGALLPPGVDTVVLEEDTRADGRRVVFQGPVRRGANTRRAGEDVVAGTTALAAGQVLRPPDLALAAALGLDSLTVHRRLRVGVLSTGDELVSPGAAAGPAQTCDANRPMLLALAARWGHQPVDLGRVGDVRAALAARLDDAKADAILTSGGASAGDEDHVSALLREAGTLHSWRIALKPGRPLALGLWAGRPVFGLPGNPVAAFVCALIFARPALARLSGAPWPETVGFDVPAAFAKRKKPGRREYLRARLRGGRAEIFASEGSGRISGLSWAEGLVELDDAAAEIELGDAVRYLPYTAFGL